MDEPLMEVRETLVVSPAGDSKPNRRTAHFLRPTTNSADGSDSEALSSSASSVPSVFAPKQWPLTIRFNGWRNLRKWLGWVEALSPKYGPLWKKAGIFEAIMSTRCRILRTENSAALLLGVAERWCSATNTFAFPWAEATVTLEDVTVLGGYPLVGKPVHAAALGGEKEARDAEKKLRLARKEAGKSRHNKATVSAWMGVFVGKGSEVEHEAFLAAWLSFFVFSHGCLVRESLFPIAVLLARGDRVALAPAVLASLYRDLDLLKRAIVGLRKNPELGNEVRFEVTLNSPLYLVQVWVWERFKNLQPNPKFIGNGDPVLARWNKVRPLKVENVREALDSAAEDFLWRPYARHGGGSSKCRVFYPENEVLVPFDPKDGGLVSFVRCLRVSELVGFVGSVNFVKQYFPHRVAMQFGMDQDIPASVPRFDGSPAVAWENYCRPVSDENLYFPSRLFEADVTPRYAAWWRQSRLVKANRVANDADVPPGFRPKPVVGTHDSGKSSEEGPRSGRRGNGEADLLSGFLVKRLRACRSSVQDGSKRDGNCDADKNCDDGDENLNAANSFDGMVQSGKVTIDEDKDNLSSSSASTAHHGAARETLLPQEKPVVIVIADDDDSEPSMEEGLDKDFGDASGSKEQGLSFDKVSTPENELGGGDGRSFDINMVADLKERISRLERWYQV